MIPDRRDAWAEILPDNQYFHNVWEAGNLTIHPFLNGARFSNV
jgi:hypothetical protein